MHPFYMTGIAFICMEASRVTKGASQGRIRGTSATHVLRDCMCGPTCAAWPGTYLTIVKRRFALWPHTEQEKGRRPRCFCWCLSTVSMCTTVVSETDPTDNTWSPIQARMKRKRRWQGGSNTLGGGKGKLWLWGRDRKHGARHRAPALLLSTRPHLDSWSLRLQAYPQVAHTKGL
jgi:hypothetical protein